MITINLNITEEDLKSKNGFNEVNEEISFRILKLLNSIEFNTWSLFFNNDRFIDIRYDFYTSDTLLRRIYYYNNFYNIHRDIFYN